MLLVKKREPENRETDLKNQKQMPANSIIILSVLALQLS